MAMQYPKFHSARPFVKSISILDTCGSGSNGSFGVVDVAYCYIVTDKLNLTTAFHYLHNLILRFAVKQFLTRVAVPCLGWWMGPTRV